MLYFWPPYSLSLYDGKRTLSKLKLHLDILLFDTVQWLSISFRINFKVSTKTQKVLNDLVFPHHCGLVVYYAFSCNLNLCMKIIHKCYLLWKKILDIHGLLLFIFFFQELEDMLSKKPEGVMQGRGRQKFKKTWTENRRREGKGSNRIMKMKSLRTDKRPGKQPFHIGAEGQRTREVSYSKTKPPKQKLELIALSIVVHVERGFAVLLKIQTNITAETWETHTY